MSPSVPSRPVHPTAPPAALVTPPPPTILAPLALDSASLLRGARELVIRHGEDLYRLRHTRNDKLILTK